VKSLDRHDVKSVADLGEIRSNVHNHDGDTTYCPSCNTALIERDWYEITAYRLSADGHCPNCQTAIAGRFDAVAGQFGRQRIPVRIGGFA
jgi:pyruvate formate lyase activating enzyme